MTDGQPIVLSAEWKERLGLADRRPPDLYESSEAVTDAPHAIAIRTALDELGLSAVFCVQGVPTVAIVSVDEYDSTSIVDLHGALWNQGLASVLMVISASTLRVFSLVKKPYKDSGQEFDRRCLIETLYLTSDALQFRNFISGTESGRLWRDYAAYFDPKERIDQILLENLVESHRLLCKAQLSSDASQALLIQAMFIAYLEDRQIITREYFRGVSGDQLENFSSMLMKGDVKALRSLFANLRADFNGDLFVAPCSFESQRKAPSIEPEHLKVLARFRLGAEEMGRGGQQRFWGYDFRFIPIELVSAVYDRFLGEEEDQRRDQGAYYTPMFLADTVVSQVWDLSSNQVRENGHYLDPACGSGVFLVRSFQRLCEHWRATRKSRTIRWDSLITILQRVHGWDLNAGAVRVAVFSLYVALLEEVSPPDIRRLISRGKILPELWNHTLLCRDFFETPDVSTRYDVIIGNPPWASRRGADRSSIRWAKKARLPMPGGEDAWAFAWKAAQHLSDQGSVAFLLPAMGFLHNHAANTVEARRKFIYENRVHRVINFADLRFQLFENAHRPAALIIYGKSRVEGPAYRFDYWAPKADLNLKIKRVITLSSADKLFLNAATAAENPLVFKQRLWMREPDAKLFSYLSRLPKLCDLIQDFGSVSRRKENIAGRWVIGQGFQPRNTDPERKQSSPYSVSKYVGTLPDLPIAAFERFAQPAAGLVPWPSKRVRRKGFEAGFQGVRILIPRGVETSQMRLRAAYVDHACTFQHIIQAITVPAHEHNRAKLLTALLNSRVAVWYAFHGTASFGSDRPEVQQAELLHLPFPSPADLPDPQRAECAAKELTAMVDDAIARSSTPFSLDGGDGADLRKLDQLAYDYFCLSEDEIILIEDTVEKILPAVQPREGNYPELWKGPSAYERQAYATTLIRSIGNWLQGNGAITARLEAKSADLGILRLSLGAGSAGYTENADASIADVLGRISQHLQQPLDGNFQITPDVRIFIGEDLHVIKPMQLRFWLRATALADADAIAKDLQDAVELQAELR